MVIDSSALIAIMSNEPERRPFEQSIRMAATRLLGAASLVETSIVVLSRRREEGLAVLNEVLADMRVETVPLSADHARLAIDAFRHFGKGVTRLSSISATASPTRSPKRPANPCCSRATTSPKPISSGPFDHVRRGSRKWGAVSHVIAASDGTFPAGGESVG